MLEVKGAEHKLDDIDDALQRAEGRTIGEIAVGFSALLTRKRRDNALEVSRIAADPFDRTSQATQQLPAACRHEDYSGLMPASFTVTAARRSSPSIVPFRLSVIIVAAIEISRKAARRDPRSRGARCDTVVANAI